MAPFLSEARDELAIDATSAPAQNVVHAPPTTAIFPRGNHGKSD